MGAHNFCTNTLLFIIVTRVANASLKYFLEFSFVHTKIILRWLSSPDSTRLFLIFQFFQKWDTSSLLSLLPFPNLSSTILMTFLALSWSKMSFILFIFLWLTFVLFWLVYAKCFQPYGRSSLIFQGWWLLRTTNKHNET